MTSVTTAVEPVVKVTRPTSPSPVIDGLVDAQAVPGALVDVDRRSPDGGVLADDPRGDGAGRLQAERLVAGAAATTAARSRARPRSRRPPRGGRCRARVRRSAFWPLASNVSPTQPNEVAHGLQRPAGAVLDRARRPSKTPRWTSRRPRRPAEGGGQEDDGADDEQREHCPSSADRLVVHVVGVGRWVAGHGRASR